MLNLWYQLCKEMHCHLPDVWSIKQHRKCIKQTRLSFSFLSDKGMYYITLILKPIILFPLSIEIAAIWFLEALSWMLWKQNFISEYWITKLYDLERKKLETPPFKMFNIPKHTQQICIYAEHMKTLPDKIVRHITFTNKEWRQRL